MSTDSPLRIVPDPPLANEKIPEPPTPSEIVTLRVVGSGQFRYRWKEYSVGEEVRVKRSDLPGLASGFAPRSHRDPRSGEMIAGPPLLAVAEEWDRKIAEEQRAAAESAQRKVSDDRAEKLARREYEHRRRMQGIEGDVARVKAKVDEATARVQWHLDAIAYFEREGAPSSKISDGNHLLGIARQRARILQNELATAEERLRDAQAAEQQIAS